MGFRSWLLKPLFAADTTGDWYVAFRDALEANKTHAGVSVTQESSVGLPAVYRCMSLNSDTIATTPLDSFRKSGKNRIEYPKPRWLEQPTDYLDTCECLGQLQASLEADGNAFALKAVTRSGSLAGLFPLNPEVVDVERLKDGQIVYDIKQDDGTMIRVQQNEMLHVRGFTPAGAIRGISPIAALKQAIGLGLAAQQFGAQFFGNGAHLGGVVEFPGPDPGEEKAKRVKESFTHKHGGLSKSHALGILYGGAKWVPVTVKPEEAQFLETRRSNAVEIACAFGVPAWFVTDIEGAKGYVSGLYATMYMWLLTGINVRFVRMERALSALLPDKNAYVKFNRNSFLAMDPRERSDYYSKGLMGRYLTPNRICALEDMDPLPGGDEALWSVQWGPPPEVRTQSNQAPQGAFSMPGGSDDAA